MSKGLKRSFWTIGLTLILAVVYAIARHLGIDLPMLPGLVE